ncbi:MAG: AsmA family protein [Gammaproteobacteria bacterium]|nr:AsmA family protein [Gammaproteobacteria bacterium]
MGKLLKWLVGLVLSTVVLIAAAVVVLPMVVDPNDYKPQIVSAAKKQLGRDFAIEQDLRLSVFPWLGIETGGVRVGNAAGFSDQPFAEVEQLGVKVKLMPLLSKRVEIDTLVVKGLRVSLEKDAAGKTNWDDLAKGQGSAAEQEASPQEPSGGGSDLALSVNGIEISDARIAWDDRQAGQKYVLDGVRLVTGSVAPGATVPVEAGVRFTSSKPAMTLDAGLSANVTSDARLKVFDIAGLKLRLDAKGEGLPAGGAELKLSADASANLDADTLTISALRIEGPAMTATGNVNVSALQKNPAVKAKLAIAETNPKTLASMFASTIETTDPNALTRVSGDVAVAYADGAIRLDPLSIKLDESSLTGHVHLLDTVGPKVRTVMQLDQIDLDRYMPPASAKPEEKPAKTGGGTSTADPFEALRPLDLEGEFRIGKLKVNNLRMNDVSTKVVSKKGVLKLDPMAAKLYDGKFGGTVELNASGKTPKLKAKQQLQGIQVGPLLVDLAGQDRLLGVGEVALDLSMIGLTESEIRRTLNGTSNFAFRDGAVKGVNIAQLIRDASSALGLGSDKLDTGTPGQTDFSEMSGSVTITNGVVKNSDLQAKSPLLRVSGKGEVDLPKDTIDYLVTTELVGSLAGQGGKGSDELAGVPIPVRISGPLTGPSFRPDLEKALSAKAKQKLESKKQEVLEKVEEKAGGKLDGVLKGLFK